MPSDQQRGRTPSGWIRLTRNDSVNRIIDALLDAPSTREYNKSELAEKAGVHRKSVGRNIDLLVEVGVVEESTEGHNTYRLNAKSDVTQAIMELDGAMNRAGPHGDGNAE